MSTSKVSPEVVDALKRLAVDTARSKVSGSEPMTDEEWEDFKARQVAVHNPPE